MASSSSRARSKGWGTRDFDESDSKRIAGELAENLGRDHLASRRGAGGMKLTYVEGWRVIDIANKVFGFNGWSCSLLQCVTEFCEEDSRGRWKVSCSATVRVSLRDGTSHEDIGFGSAEGLKCRAKSLEKAKKQAVTDARKRVLRIFGNGLGNCVYNKVHVKEVQRGGRMSTAVRGSSSSASAKAAAKPTVAAIVAAMPPQPHPQPQPQRAVVSAPLPAAVDEFDEFDDGMSSSQLSKAMAQAENGEPQQKRLRT
jgi:DNA repair and recombination protein RAD52|tara:strand:+ start:1039 stop:1803 length:765 start_codon:yes stop_codon:yes gene_type:complete